MGIRISKLLSKSQDIANEDKGDYAVQLACLFFIRHGFEVAHTIGDKRTYDLIVEKNGRVFRVQSKYTSTIEKNNLPPSCFRLKLCKRDHTMERGKGGIPYEDGDFDALWVVTPRSMYLIEEAGFKGKTCINLGKHYDKYKVGAPPW